MPACLPRNDANRLGLDYRLAAKAFERVLAAPDQVKAPDGILDVHSHIGSSASARAFLEVADLYGVHKTFTMTGWDNVTEMREHLSEQELERIEFICVPDYSKKQTPGTFTTQWLEDIRQFAKIGCRVMKFWCGPRGRDLFNVDSLPDELKQEQAKWGNPFVMDSPIRKQGMKLAYELGYRVFMVHVADPDTWFETTYQDASHYGTKRDQYKPFEQAMLAYPDVTWIAAHTAGSPEDLDFVQRLLDKHPNLVIDISACKWQVRELSQKPKAFADFVRRNQGRVLFGSDIVAWDENNLTVEQAAQAQADDPDHGTPDGFDLYASRYWAFRTLIETDYDGMSPIVDPDYVLLDPKADPKQTARLRGASIEGEALAWLYRKAAERVFESVGGVWETPTARR